MIKNNLPINFYHSSNYQAYKELHLSTWFSMSTTTYHEVKQPFIQQPSPHPQEKINNDSISNWYEILFCNHAIQFKDPKSGKLVILEISNESSDIFKFCNIQKSFWCTTPMNFTCDLTLTAYDEVSYDELKNENMSDEEMSVIETKMQTSRVVWKKTKCRKSFIAVILYNLNQQKMTTTDIF